MAFLTQLGGEMRKLFARQRTYIGFGAYLLIEVLLLFLLQLPKLKHGFQHFIESQGYFFEQYFSGLTLAFMIVSWTVFILAPLYLALVSGDVVSKEVEDGTMRMILSRPVSRFRVVFVRYVAVVLYTIIFITLVAASALAVGLLRNGVGGMFVFAPTQKILAVYDFAPGLERFAMAVPLMALSFISIASLGFLFSCCNMKPSAATIICLSLYFIDMILQGIPQFTLIREWFLTTHMLTWMNIFRAQVPTWDMVEDYAYLLGADATFFTIGALIFQGRDFKA